MAFVEFDDILKECDEQIAELRWDNKQLFSSEGEKCSSICYSKWGLQEPHRRFA